MNKNENGTLVSRYEDLLKENIKHSLDFYTWNESQLLLIKDFIRCIRKKDYDSVIGDMLDLKALAVFELLEDRKKKGYNVK